MSLNPIAWIGNYTLALGGAIQTGFFMFFLILGLRALLKRDWIAAVSGALIFALLEGRLFSAPNWLTFLAVYVFIFGILIFVLLRLGLVANMALVFFVNVMSAQSLGLDWSAWYAPAGIAHLALLAGIVLLAFRLSLGDRELLSPDDAK
jgi:hypothetical protein